MKFLLLLSCLIFSAEMEVDGNLKVTGTVDASGNAITNVGVPQTMTDAVNAGILQSALSDDGVYELMFLYIKFQGSYESSLSTPRYVKYAIPTNTDTGNISWILGGISKLNQLMLEGWRISARLQPNVDMFVYELQRKIND